jgi:anti-sigma factor RsiW
MEETCQFVQERLDAYVGATLPGPESPGIDRHLRRCAACREALVLEQGLAGLAAAPARPAAGNFAEQVMRAREDERTPERLDRRARAHWAALAAFAFRILVDPLLWVEYQLHYALVPLGPALTAPLRDAAAGAYRSSTAPLRLVCGRIRTPLTHRIC